MGEMQTMISVIIPSYNSKDTIIDCINSVIHQTRYDLIDEIIVVDDGSTDNSSDLIVSVFNNIKKIKVIKKQNGGVSSARNTGIKNAHSEWIALLDSDDCWFSDKIEAQFEMISRYPDIVFIGTNRNNENYQKGKKINDKLYALKLKDILIRTWPHTSTVLIKKSILDQVGGYNEAMKYAEDGDLWNRIAIQHDLYYIPITYETAGGNKKQFGEKGLSANLSEMYKGNVRNIKILRNNGSISLFFYCFLRLFYFTKHIRRIILSYFYKKKANR